MRVTSTWRWRSPMRNRARVFLSGAFIMGAGRDWRVPTTSHVWTGTARVAHAQHTHTRTQTHLQVLQRTDLSFISARVRRTLVENSQPNTIQQYKRNVTKIDEKTHTRMHQGCMYVRAYLLSYVSNDVANIAGKAAVRCKSNSGATNRTQRRFGKDLDALSPRPQQQHALAQHFPRSSCSCSVQFFFLHRVFVCIIHCHRLKPPLKVFIFVFASRNISSTRLQTAKAATAYRQERASNASR